MKLAGEWKCCRHLTRATFAMEELVRDIYDDIVSDKAVPANKVCGLFEVEEKKGQQWRNIDNVTVNAINALAGSIVVLLILCK